MIKKSYEIQTQTSDLLKYNLILLYGENYGLKKDIKTIIEKTTNELEINIEYLSFYEHEIINNEENFNNSVHSGSLFSKKKIITVNDASDKILKHIQNIIDKCPENIILIIFSGILEKKSKLRNIFEKNKNTLCIPCYLDNQKDLESIIMNEIKKNNLILSRESTNLLIEKCNNDRNNLRNEIEKIKSYALNKKKLEFDEIKNLINFSGEYKSDILINECLCGNVHQFKKKLSELYAGTVNQILLLRVLSNKVHRLLDMKKPEEDHSNLDNLLNTFKPPIFWQEKMMVKKQLMVWNLKDLKQTIKEINYTELLCKKNPQIARVIFFNFFTNLCKKANSFS